MQVSVMFLEIVLKLPQALEWEMDCRRLRREKGGQQEAMVVVPVKGDVGLDESGNGAVRKGWFG